MSLTYICSAFVGVVLSNVLVERLSLRVRITVGYALSFVVLLLVAVLDVAGRAGFSPGASYRVTLIAVAVVALGCTGTEGEFSRGGSGGVTRVTISCYYYACDLSYFDGVLCPSSNQIHSPVSPHPLNARSLRSLGFPKSPPPLKKS